MSIPASGKTKKINKGKKMNHVYKLFVGGTWLVVLINFYNNISYVGDHAWIDAG